MESWIRLSLVFVACHGGLGETLKSLPTPAPEFTCPGDGFYTLNGQCLKEYYYCTNGQPFYQVCPDPYVFDPLVDTCVDKNSCSVPETFECPTEDGFFPVPGTCDSEYYVCTGGIAQIYTCPMNTIFDPLTYLCTPADEATCNMTFDCPSDVGMQYVTYPGACSSLYFLCLDGVSFVQYCPAGYIFDAEKQTCVIRENAPCLGKSKNCLEHLE